MKLLWWVVCTGSVVPKAGREGGKVKFEQRVSVRAKDVMWLLEVVVSW
jgi:hypothetical protein